MAVIIKTTSPSKLLDLIYEAIDDEKIETWASDSDGDFTHTPSQWNKKAWLRPKVHSNELRFGILGQKDIELSTIYYAVYHGRFIEMLLSHFDKEFITAEATAQEAEPDDF